MIRSNTMVLVKAVIWDLLGNAVYFPIWWYTRGLKRMAEFLIDFIRAMEMRLAVRIWIANILKPMYAVTDIPGRIISFLMRVFMIIVRSLALFFIIIFALIAFIFYILWPIFLVLMILVQLGRAVI